MNKTKIFVGIFLAVNLLAVGTALLLFSGFEGGRTAFAPNRNNALSDSSGLSSDESVPVLNRDLLSLLDSDNAAVRQTYFGRCYAELTPRGNFRLTYFTPYLSLHFAREKGSDSGWPEGYSDGFYEENPLADGLLIRRIDLCEEIDPKEPSLLGRQLSLRQLIQTTGPITYDLLCEVLEQTPELSHIGYVYYDPGFIFDDPEARSAAEEGAFRGGQRITGGEDVAVFLVDDVEIKVSFIHVQEETLAFYIILQKAN